MVHPLCHVCSVCSSTVSPVPGLEPLVQTLSYHPVTVYVNLSCGDNKHGNVFAWAPFPEGRPAVTYVP